METTPHPERAERSSTKVTTLEFLAGYQQRIVVLCDVLSERLPGHESFQRDSC